MFLVGGTPLSWDMDKLDICDLLKPRLREVKIVYQVDNIFMSSLHIFFSTLVLLSVATRNICMEKYRLWPSDRNQIRRVI